MSRSDRPRIALVRLGDGLVRRFLQKKYVDCLTRAGADVFLVDPDPSSADRCARDYDGFLFPGGDDVDPARYGEEKRACCGAVAAARDAFELPLLSAVLREKKPALGICRGAQIINVALGGTLFQDIRVDTGRSFNHFDVPKMARRAHDVTVTPDTLLASVVGAGTLPVNSMHHQAVDRVAAPLRVSAVSFDGLAEALEAPEYPFLLCVQWHPEHLGAKSARQQRIFEAFVAAAGR
ncbi:MAG: gamma-glutamyl-gamma-aminobutyrate hydrolase family protein [Oscillospiraceae bacterium]|nr:gamma-glutamyl-gamma-aminobutyrate hydrolase family protein [Oscillospiraceae bacterium]